MLATMFQDGYPVPEGFVILPSVFLEDKLKHEAWEKVQAYISAIKAKENHSDAMFAVRSSALSEDASQASFAGEFETVLNRRTDEEICEAIHIVYHSRFSERVKVYSSIQGMAEAHQIAVVVQLMVARDSRAICFIGTMHRLLRNG